MSQALDKSQQQPEVSEDVEEQDQRPTPTLSATSAAQSSTIANPHQQSGATERVEEQEHSPAPASASSAIRPSATSASPDPPPKVTHLLIAKMSNNIFCVHNLQSNAVV